MKWAQEEAEPSENENDRQWANCETLKAIKLTRRAFSTRIDQVRCWRSIDWCAFLQKVGNERHQRQIRHSAVKSEQPIGSGVFKSRIGIRFHKILRRRTLANIPHLLLQYHLNSSEHSTDRIYWGGYYPCCKHERFRPQKKPRYWRTTSYRFRRLWIVKSIIFPPYCFVHPFFFSKERWISLLTRDILPTALRSLLCAGDKQL